MAVRKKNVASEPELEVIDKLPVVLLQVWFNSHWDAQDVLLVLLALGCRSLGHVCDLLVENDMTLEGIDNPLPDPITEVISDRAICALLLTLQREAPEHRFLALFAEKYASPTEEDLKALNLVVPADLQDMPALATEPLPEPEPVAIEVADPAVFSAEATAVPAPASTTAPQKRGGIWGKFMDRLHT